MGKSEAQENGMICPVSCKWEQKGQSRNNNQVSWLQLQDLLTEKCYLLSIFSNKESLTKTIYNLSIIWKKNLEVGQKH